MVFRKQVVEGADFAHQSKEIGVVKEKDVQSHLDVIAIGIDPAANFPAHKGTGFVEVHLMTGIHQIHRSGQACQTGTNNRDPHHLACNWGDSMKRPDFTASGSGPQAFIK